MRNLIVPKIQPPLSAFALALPEACGHGGIHSQKYFEDPNLPLVSPNHCSTLPPPAQRKQNMAWFKTSLPSPCRNTPNVPQFDSEGSLSSLTSPNPNPTTSTSPQLVSHLQPPCKNPPGVPRKGYSVPGGGTDLGEAPDRAEEVGAVAPCGRSVCQGLRKLWRLHHVPLGDLLWLVSGF